ncbi:MAG: tRNA(Ile)(2)-agmatinylcytidine synthase [Nitrososphaera sp.]
MSSLHIAFDDTDSRLGRCTTHLAFRLAKALLQSGCADSFIDYPNLIRLNPNIPWKTRGNGAVCLRMRTKRPEDAKELAVEEIKNQSAIGAGANPGIALYEGDALPSVLRDFSSRAMSDVLSRQQAEKVAIQAGVEFKVFGNGQGLVGALGALGCWLDEFDHTFELIGYRRDENCGTARIVEPEKVKQFSSETYPDTFNSYDPYHDRVLVAPHGPDPVFFGIRGESPEAVSRGITALQPYEDLEGFAVFRTNQGTNMHLQNELSLQTIKAYTAGFARCRVSTPPVIAEGGHVFFSVKQADYEMPAAAYEPTGLFHVVSKLEPGDFVEIGFGVRKGTTKHPKILNIEYLRIIQLEQVFELANPQCTACGKKMKSEGRGKGFQCPRCKLKDPLACKVRLPRIRDIEPGLYLPHAKAHRHLTKPLQRYGREKKGAAAMPPRREFILPS